MADAKTAEQPLLRNGHPTTLTERVQTYFQSAMPWAQKQKASHNAAKWAAKAASKSRK